MSETVTREVQKENKMGVQPINKLLFGMSVPMMISMLVTALYNIVDSIFVAQISENALTAVSLANPIQTLMIALGTGTCVGVNALLSRSLGEKNFERASDVAKNGIFMTVICYLVFLLIGLFVVKPFFMAQTNDAEIVTYGIEYLSIVCCSSFVCLVSLFLNVCYNRLVVHCILCIHSLWEQSSI